MRYALTAVILALSLAATPVQAKGPLDFVTDIPRDFKTGAQFYFETVGGWFATLLDLLGLTEKLSIAGEGDACAQSTRCTLGLVCLNVCDGAGCDVYEKRCVDGPDRVDILGEYSRCDGGQLCADGTYCTRTCPVGADCGGGTHRCMRPIEPGGSCTAADDCRTACGQFPFPPIGPSGYVARCAEGSCVCDVVELDPGAERTACPAGVKQELVCPAGTHQACTASSCPSGACEPRLTCLTAPAYGGTCLEEAECSDAACAEGSSPFCDAADKRCKCRSTEILTISCATAADCSAAAACGANEIQACVEGACACAPAVVVTTCTAASECSSNCPEGFGRACVEGQCACQRVTENVPVACETVDQCGGVSCPESYDKACIDAKCACTRTVTQ